MNITVLDDWQNTVRTLPSFAKLAGHQVTIWNDHTKDVGEEMVYAGWTNAPRRERGLALVQKAMVLSPFHPDHYHFAPAWIHWWKGEYDQALTEAQKINMPDFFGTHVLLATIYGALGRKADAAPAIANLLKLYPDITEKIREEGRKWNNPDEVIDRAIADLRRAGLNIPPGT